MNHQPIALMSTLVWAFFSVGYCPAAEALKDRFLREAPEGWRTLRTAAEKVVGEGRFLNIAKESGKIVIELEFKFKRNGDWLLWERADVKKEPVPYVVTAANSSYGFELRRANDKGEWVLTRVGSDEKTMLSARELARLDFLGFLECPWTIGGQFQLDEMIVHSTFRVTSIEQVSNGGRELVKLQFQAAIDLVQRNQPPLKLRTGWILFDPTLSWAVRECDVVLDPNRRLHLLMEYATPADQNRLLKVTGTRFTNQKAEHDVVFEFKSVDQRAAPESEFRLSAYGFAEPDFIIKSRPARTGWWLWLALAGAVLLVLAAAFGWLRQRARR